MRCLFGLAAVLLVVFSAAAGVSADDLPPDELSSPSQRYSVRILHSALPGSDPYEGFFTIAVRCGKQYVAKYPTEGYLLEAFWSPNGKYVAVDNRRANSGDYLWVFRLSDGYAIRMPVDAPTGHPEDAYGKYVRDLVQRVTRKFPDLTYNEFNKLFTFARGWTKSGELQVKINFGFYNLPNQIAFVLDTYRISGTEPVLAEEKVEKAPWSRNTPNHAMQPTTDRRTTLMQLISTFHPAATGALASGG
jgi:hypothetical protein